LLQVQYTAGTTLFDGEAYSPEYLEFHHPSEHFVSSKQFDLELQIHHVHRSDPSKRLAVVVMFVLSLYDNPFLEELQFTDLPGRAGDSNRLPAPFNPGHGMPMNPDYFDYDGSLTAPPCTEGVKFVVMNERPGVSSEQVWALRLAALHHFGSNAPGLCIHTRLKATRIRWNQPSPSRLRPPFSTCLSVHVHRTPC
jgi:carbonic anhydrase